MAQIFSCTTDSGEVLASWLLDVDGDELTLTTRCNELKLQSGGTRVPGNPINSGDAPVLKGPWFNVLDSVLGATVAALENVPIVEGTPFLDRYAHQLLRTTLAERSDVILSRLSKLNLDDRAKFEQRMMRDFSAVVRALEGDIYILQQMLGQALIRLDKLEKWSVAQPGVPLPTRSDSYTDPMDPPSVPFPDLEEGKAHWNFGDDVPINPAEFHNSFVPHNHASNVQEDFLYHQGYHSVNSLKRFWNAVRAMGIDEPDTIDPRDNEPFSDKRYNEGQY